MRQRPRGRPPSHEISAPQRRTLKEIILFRDGRGFPPTVKELADILEISPPSAHGQVNQLVRKGYLRRDPGQARGISVLREPGDGVPDLVPVPIVGQVAAGQPIFAEENIVGQVLVEGRIARSGRCFAFEVKGDSMVNAGIRGRDLVVVRQQPIAENGDIVVTMIGEEAKVKRLFIREEKIELRPENPKYRPIRVGPDDGLLILGKVVSVKHQLRGR